MKRIIVLLIALAPTLALAQWNTAANPPHISYTNGNVGIGTSTPAYALSIFSASQNVLSVKSSSHSVIDIESGSGLNSYLRFVNNGTLKWDLTGETSGNLRIYDYAAGLTRFVITPLGNVGIGSSVPTQKIDIVGRGKIRANGGSSAGIWFTGNDGTEQVFLGQVNVSSTDPFGIYHGGTWRFSVASNGYVGIGTITRRKNLM